MLRFTIKAAVSALLAGQSLAGSPTKKPNILFILTDDMDSHMGAMEHMPLLQKYMVNEGTLYSNHYCTVALCCPSRVNLWTGRLSHNTNVTDVFPPYGGYPKIVDQGINDDYLPLWMQSLGYTTYYAGKLWNGHSIDNYASPPVRGYNRSDFILDPHTYEYFNAWMTRDGAAPVSYAGQYSPDVTAQKAYEFLDEAMSSPDSTPWFLTVAPIAPHSNIQLTPTYAADAPRYADRHAHLFRDYEIPRDSGNFNPETPSGVGWVADLPRLNDTVVAYNDEFQRSRLRALQAVDEMVEGLIARLAEKEGELENTYIFYTTDNGYHISQHRMHPGKECGYETDIRIPLLVRGPGVPKGRTSGVVSSHTDIVPTILRIAGAGEAEEAQGGHNLDGEPMPLAEDQLAEPNKFEHVNVEFWGMAIPEGRFGKNGDAGSPIENPIMWASARNNTYKSVRLIGESYNLYYSVWCTGDKEYYDLTTDPAQVRNLLDPRYASLAASYSVAGRPLDQVLSRVDALLMVLKSCRGDTCRRPWEALHSSSFFSSSSSSPSPSSPSPSSSSSSSTLAAAVNGGGGGGGGLERALAPRFDALYAAQARVSFSRCELGLVLDAEGPQFEVWDVEEEEEEEGWLSWLGAGRQQGGEEERGKKQTPVELRSEAADDGGEERERAGDSVGGSFEYRGRWSEWT